MVESTGNPDVPVFARSTLKPFFAVGTLRAGLDLGERQLALACASHNGGSEHIAVVTSILTRYGLSPDDLGNAPATPSALPGARPSPPGTPPTASTRTARASTPPYSLATAVVGGWDTATYLDHDRPVAVLVHEVVKN